MALLDQVLDHGVVRRQVQDVVLHDAGRNDQHRLWQHLVGGRAVLDQLDQVVAEHHLARGAGHVLAYGVGQGLQRFCRRVWPGIACGFQVLHKQLQTLAQAFALRFPGLGQHFGIGQCPVRGGQRVHPLPGKELHELAVVTCHAIDLDGFAPPAVSGLETFLHHTVGPLLPGSVLKACIAFSRGLCRRFGRLLHQLCGALRKQHLLARGRSQMQPPVCGGQPQGNGRQAHGHMAHGRSNAVIQCLCRFCLRISLCIFDYHFVPIAKLQLVSSFTCILRKSGIFSKCEPANLDIHQDRKTTACARCMAEHPPKPIFAPQPAPYAPLFHQA